MDDIHAETFDLLIDEAQNEIFIRGKQFSSEEIPSKKATIALLKHFIQHRNKMLKNTDLPTSNYAKYRNDLQGKLITPLSTLVRQETEKSLGIHVTGKLHAFTIRFDPPKDLNIGILQKL